jgi:hypothetical protein
MVPGQLGKKFVGFYVKGEKLGVVVHACHPSKCRKTKIER